jgi:hypothetical protein
VQKGVLCCCCWLQCGMCSFLVSIGLGTALCIAAAVRCSMIQRQQCRAGRHYEMAHGRGRALEAPIRRGPLIHTLHMTGMDLTLALADEWGCLVLCMGVRQGRTGQQRIHTVLSPLTLC